jgi:flagellar hook-associated protein 2
VANLFGAVGSASDNLVSYTSASNSTQPGTYGVSITQIATQGNVKGTTAVAPSTTITTASNDGLNLIVNGVSATITLAAGTYTPETLSTEIQNKINASAALSPSGTTVNAGIDLSGMLTITSGKYGSASSVIVSAGTSSTDLFGVAPTVATTGLDVAGTIGDSAAAGSGQTLTSSSGNAIGLVITVNGGNAGLRGTVSYSQGYASKLNNLTTSLLANDGLLAGRTNGINNTIKDIGNRRDSLIQRLAGIEASYRKQYSALDVMLTSFNQTSTYLTQQLARL